MPARNDLTLIGKRSDEPDGSMAAHPEAAGSVEENDSGDTVCLCRLAEQCAHHGIGTTRLSDNRAPKRRVVLLKDLPPALQASVA
jgi:hypothetical protein